MDAASSDAANSDKGSAFGVRLSITGVGENEITLHDRRWSRTRLLVFQQAVRHKANGSRARADNNGALFNQAVCPSERDPSLKSNLMDILVCPTCHGALRLFDERLQNGEVESGSLRCDICRLQYPVVRSVPRFVRTQNYAGSFGFQWNRFPRTQLDSYSGLPISRERFFTYSGWTPHELQDKLVLDIGCGSGRFAEIALDSGAQVVAIDYSQAVDACWSNLAARGPINVIQADAFRLPLRSGVFDYVYCFGVLQHTPDPHGAFVALLAALSPGGRIAVDIYPKLWKNVLWPKYWLRPLSRRISRERLFRIVERAVPVLLPISRAIGRIPKMGRHLRYLVPVVNYEGFYSLSESQLREWAVLDTFDMLSPEHDHPQTAATLRRWLNEGNLQDIEVFRHGFLVGRGRKPLVSD